jgi:cation diffusion facilitator CzcD-associated flavoprotein CzcO
VVLVDRRHGPGGHWNDAYPFVRLHAPSALYGVNSRQLGSDVIDQDGPNAGLYPRATAAEICSYYQQVLDEQLLASGRVRFFGMSEYSADTGGHRLTSRLTGEPPRSGYGSGSWTPGTSSRRSRPPMSRRSPSSQARG